MMAKKSAADIDGLEYDWIACDAIGNVALFSTAGAGHTPEEFLEDTGMYDAAIAEILKLQPTTTPLFAPDLDAECNTWGRMAERGIYAFDSSPNGGPYALVAAPHIPVDCAMLPALTASVARRIVFRHVKFGVSKTLEIELASRT